MESEFSLAAFSYELPPELIAQAPATPRDSSRLLVVDRATAALEHRRFNELSCWLKPGDLVVVNRTQVLKARLKVKKSTGKVLELLPYQALTEDIRTALVWDCLARPLKSLKPDMQLTTLDEQMSFTVLSKSNETVRLKAPRPLLEILEQYGEVPLPPYIQPTALDLQAAEQTYQTIFANEQGAVAAPTAGLHFTEELVAHLQTRGVAFADVVLHVGPGTFLPIRQDCLADIRQHQMHAEWYSIPESTLSKLKEVKAAGGRVIAVGTTSVRALESYALTQELTGFSSLFIYPGFQFRLVDALITNFHLPESTLLLLVAAFWQREPLLAAYREAVARGYRFYSYGDAMLLL